MLKDKLGYLQVVLILYEKEKSNRSCVVRVDFLGEGKINWPEVENA
jgi:hypothetical protein